ncbi:MAG: hypothetical protein OXH03_02240 [Bacteroidetes bacterium]|nr:hypothetical protein [Bacteroidota bacterium]MDE2672205.1 hypothetical protein [Bacteroidota bacterium]
MSDSLADDALAVLLLCAFQGGEEKHYPLRLVEYNRVATILYRRQKRPAYLLGDAPVREIANSAQVNPARLQWLMDRRINLGFCLEEWQRKGFWISARSDKEYPERIRSRMRIGAPSLIFGTGNQTLLSNGGLAIIGPDQIPPGRSKKACETAIEAVKKGQTVVVAGHLKMAKDLVNVAQEHSGCVIWVLHDGSLKQRLEKLNRQALSRGQMVLITAQSPEAPRKTGDRGFVGSLATALADELLYVDGSKNSKDQFRTASAALRFAKTAENALRSKLCRLLVGRKVSQTIEQLRKLGAGS